MITSATNINITQAKKLLQKKYRDEYGLFVIEGAKLAREALDRNVAIKYFILDVAANESCASLANESGMPVFSVQSNVFKSLTDSVTPQGIIAVAAKPETTLRSPKGKCLILEKLQDPTNVGAILRTAAATGYNEAYLIDCADAFSPKSIRCGMSSQFCLDIFEGDFEEIFDAVSKTCAVVCADMDGKDIFDENTKIPAKHALLLGSEGKGVSAAAKQKSDFTVSIPMQNKMESLNVSVSAGILMYVLTNKCK